jgi:hypothetical protein
VIFVFVQRVHAQVDLDRRLRQGDALIVEERAVLRDGELFVAESDAGAWIGRHAAGTDPFDVFAEIAHPNHCRDAVHVRGAVTRPPATEYDRCSRDGVGRLRRVCVRVAAQP